MFFPYLRARQYELLALKELAQEKLINAKVIPVIEPIKRSTTFDNTIEAFYRAKLPLAVIFNPAVGELCGAKTNAILPHTVGDFIAQKDLIVVDLSAISKMSPFLYQGDIEQFFINRQAFQDIALEIAKPLRRNDSPLEYLPTQYISEFIKSQGYDGVAYESTMNPSGYNIAVYNETLFECNNVTTVEVKKVNYEFVQ